MSIVILFLIVVTATILGEALIRGLGVEKRLWRAAIHAQRPGCPACLYPLGGWSGSRCPECATDVMQRGVRVASDADRRWRMAIAAVVTLWLGLPAAGVLAAFLVAAGDERVDIVGRSAADRDLLVMISAEHAWSRIPPRTRRAMTVELIDTAAASGTLSFVNGRPAGMTGVRSVSLAFAGSDAGPAADHADRLEVAIDELTESRLSPEALAAHAGSIAASVESAMRTGIGARGEMTPPPVAAPFTKGGEWSGGAGPDAWRQLAAIAGTLLATVGLLVAVLRIVRRRTSDGIRACVPGEWANSGGPDLNPPRSA